MASVPTPSVIAIDGPVASGKTTVGRALAVRLGYRFVDTGLMYRALTLVALRNGIDPGNAPALGKLAAETEISIVTGPRGTAHVQADGGDVTAGLRSAEVEAPNVRCIITGRYQAVVSVPAASVPRRGPTTPRIGVRAMLNVTFTIMEVAASGTNIATLPVPEKHQSHIVVIAIINATSPATTVTSSPAYRSAPTHRATK